MGTVAQRWSATCRRRRRTSRAGSGAANSREAFLQIATLKIGCHRLFDDRPPETVLGLITLVVDLLEGVKMLIQQAPQVAGLGNAWAVERQGLDTGGGHGGKEGSWMCVYIPYENICRLAVEPTPTSLEATTSGHAGYVTEASVRPRRVSVENLSVPPMTENPTDPRRLNVPAQPEASTPETWTPKKPPNLLSRLSATAIPRRRSSSPAEATGLSVVGWANGPGRPPVPPPIELAAVLRHHVDGEPSDVCPGSPGAQSPAAGTA